MLGAIEYDFGHGLGADTPELPLLQAGVRRSIEPGTVLAVHVAVREPNGPTAFVGGPVAVDETGVFELVKGAAWSSS
jgi:hypothetical protein